MPNETAAECPTRLPPNALPYTYYCNMTDTKARRQCSFFIIVVIAAAGFCFAAVFHEARTVVELDASTRSPANKTHHPSVGIDAQAGVCQSLYITTSFINSLQSDPQSNALRAIGTTTTTANATTIDDSGSDDPRYLGGLDSKLFNSVFRGHRIALVGDSTLFYLTNWLYRLSELNATAMDALGDLDLSSANALINPSGQKDVGLEGSSHPPPIVNESDGTHIVWMGKNGMNMRTADDFGGVWARLEELQPEIIVANMGLHWLHFFGAGRDSLRAGIVARWFAYEAWLDEVIENAKRSGARILLFKTTNRICDEQFFGKLKTANAKFRALDPATLAKCRSVVEERVPSSTTVADLDLYCRTGTFNDIGVTHLNERVEAYLAKLDRSQHESLQVGLFNDNAVQSCKYTRDGRHYHGLNLLRIRLMGNLLQCYLGQVDKALPVEGTKLR